MQWSNHYEWVLNKINVGVHVVDQDGLTVFYNQTMADIDGMERDHVIGKTIFQLYPSLTFETSTLFLALKNGVTTEEAMQTYVNLQGKQITTINSTYPLYKGETIIGAVETAKDITQIVRMYDQTQQLRRELQETKKKDRATKGSATFHFYDLIGSSTNFQTAIMLAKKAARSNSPVMISGATGTGKELVAQSIHNASSRRNAPFIALNCAAVPKELMEGLLFGTTKGAFTGAIDRQGLIEQAHNGTLFLDELNSLDLILQAKLLRVLQDGKIRRLGSDNEKETDVRIITAMNIEPTKALEKQILRTDLYYRLNVVQIQLPTLQERKSDIPLLVDFFVKKLNDEFGMNVEEVSSEAIQVLKQYHWPGNIRQLQHAIESAFNVLDFGSTKLDKKHFPLTIYEETRHIPSARGFLPTKQINLPGLIEDF